MVLIEVGFADIEKFFGPADTGAIFETRMNANKTTMRLTA